MDYFHTISALHHKLLDYFTNVIDITNMLGKTNAGAELIIHDVFGAILYKGTGVFIAEGSGITPFISIFRDLNNKKEL